MKFVFDSHLILWIFYGISFGRSLGKVNMSWGRTLASNEAFSRQHQVCPEVKIDIEKRHGRQQHSKLSDCDRDGSKDRTDDVVVIIVDIGIHLDTFLFGNTGGESRQKRTSSDVKPQTMFPRVSIPPSKSFSPVMLKTFDLPFLSIIEHTTLNRLLSGKRICVQHFCCYPGLNPCRDRALDLATRKD